MTETLTITDRELEAIRAFERYVTATIPHEKRSHSQTINEDMVTVIKMLSRLAPYPPVEEVASRPNGDYAPAATGVHDARRCPITAAMKGRRRRIGDPKKKPAGKPAGDRVSDRARRLRTGSEAVCG